MAYFSRFNIGCGFLWGWGLITGYPLRNRFI